MDGWAGGIRWDRAVAVAAAVAIVATVYAMGYTVGRSSEQVLTARESATSAPGEPATPAPGKRPAPASPSPSPSAAAEDPVPVAAAGEPPPAAAEPITGPGRPPLPMAGSGPHSTRRTTGDAYIALTFDDGPDPRWTPKVLAKLREHRVKATFCVVGVMVKAHPQLVRDIVADGHTMCNHTWDHDFDLGGRSRADIREDLERTNAAIRKAAPGTRISYYRQPGGMWTKAVVAVAAELGMSSLHWAVDPRDWNGPDAEEIADVVESATDGAIVLLHDGGGDRQATVRALTRFLPRLVVRHSLGALPPGVDPPPHHGVELPLKPGQH